MTETEINLIEKIKKIEKERDFYKSLSEKDELTRLYNRRFIFNLLKSSIETAYRHNQTMSVIIADIDYFKKVNDTYGHSAGDAVLFSVAKIIADNIRISDVVGRWGGEEFLIVCPNTDILSAVILADRIRLRVEKETNSTISLGVAEYYKNDILQLIDSADKALYAAKQRGRNRVEIYKKISA